MLNAKVTNKKFICCNSAKVELESEKIDIKEKAKTQAN